MYKHLNYIATIIHVHRNSVLAVVCKTETIYYYYTVYHKYNVFLALLGDTAVIIFDWTVINYLR